MLSIDIRQVAMALAIGCCCKIHANAEMSEFATSGNDIVIDRSFKKKIVFKTHEAKAFPLASIVNGITRQYLIFL